MENKLTELTVNDIAHKHFKTSMSGYKKVQVDQYLDVIIKDYQILEEKIKQLEDFIKTNQEEPVRTRTSNGNPQANYDILKRVSNLEKAVFGVKFEDM